MLPLYKNEIAFLPHMTKLNLDLLVETVKQRKMSNPVVGHGAVFSGAQSINQIESNMRLV